MGRRIRNTDPSPSVPRASYALAPGTPALQPEPRRQRLVAFTSGALLVVLGYLIGWSAELAAPPTRLHVARAPADGWTTVEWARHIAAHATSAELLAARGPYLALLRTGVDDPDVWLGARRLCEWALRDRSAPSRQLATELARTLRSTSAPAELRALIPSLERRGGR